MVTATIPFTGNPLNRASEKRTDSNWIASKRRDASSLVLPMWQLQPFLAGSESSAPPFGLGLIDPATADSLATDGAACIFLGLDGDRAIFALDVTQADDPAKSGPLTGRGFFRDARMAALLGAIRQAAIVGRARAMMVWHQRLGSCPRGGEPTKIMDAGYRRLCAK